VWTAAREGVGYVVVESHESSNAGYVQRRRARVWSSPGAGVPFEPTRRVDLRSLAEGPLDEVARKGWVNLSLPLELEPL
jgi:hypothetical protein